MNSVLLILIILIALVVIISLAWRFASRRYSLPCPVWMKWMLDPGAGGISPRTQKTIDFLDVRPGMNVLDAGSGPGRLTIPLARLVGPDGLVTAMDLQDGMLQEVEKRAKNANLTNIHLLKAGIGEGKAGREKFDRAVLITVIGEIPDRQAALCEMYNALKPGGILLVEETIRDPHFQARAKVTQLATGAGFVEKEFSGSRFNYTMTWQKPGECLVHF